MHWLASGQPQVTAHQLHPNVAAGLIAALIPLQIVAFRQHWSMVPSPEIDLEPAIARYQAALALDPDNVTANRRLGQIELSLGRYEAAQRLLEAALRAAPGQRATRQLLGEVYAVQGNTEQAAALWSTVDSGQGRFASRIQWHKALGEDMPQRWLECGAAQDERCSE